MAPAVETLIRATPDPDGQEQARALALLARHRTVSASSVWTLSWASVGLMLLALGARAVAQATPAAAAAPSALGAGSLDGFDEPTREQALLDAADRLYRSTPPVRRF